jgi:UDP-MurNAc hydroxylase
MRRLFWTWEVAVRFASLLARKVLATWLDRRDRRIRQATVWSALLMQITFLGHAGFCVETAQSILITDPWLSPTGAFDSAWFQLPRNHHMASCVEQKLHTRDKEKYVYISHEHKDHFDPAFLRTFTTRDFTLIIPMFRRTALSDALRGYECKEIRSCRDGEKITLKDGYLRLFVDDSELNRDSAVLMRAGDKGFLNLNDCKLYDCLPQIVREEGKIDVFTCQFSGATWHPTCYEYEKEEYENISRKKQLTKFEAVARAIHTVDPAVFVPSAGPACFLDPTLFHLNLQPVNIFPYAPRLLEYLRRRLPHARAQEMMPGDVLDAATGTLKFQVEERITDDNRSEYLSAYAADYAQYFENRKQSSMRNAEQVLEQLQAELQRKLGCMLLAERIKAPLYIWFPDSVEHCLKVDFATRKVTRQGVHLNGEPYYSFSAPSWEIARVLEGHLTWEDFSLSFRMRLSRNPDLYQPLVQGFLILQAEDLNYFCEKVLALEARKERMIVQCNGSRYAIDRYCPHQGADLKHAWVDQQRYLTCPRHRWQFDMHDQGRCLTNGSTINAICIDDD